MRHVTAFIKLIRPVNALLASIGVALGFWLSGADAPYMHLLLLVGATACALGFGNTINDIKDAAADRINHPQRPIPRGDISRNQALIFAVILAVLALIAGTAVSLNHLYGVIVPLVLLTLYTLFLKGTPLFGNILISILVSYSLIFGGLNTQGLHTIYIPALLAFLLNLAREIIKDLQDREGDQKTGIVTTASLSPAILKNLLILISILYIPLMFIPYFLDHFHNVYLIICAAILLPMHLYRLIILVIIKKMADQARISLLLKIEMLGGLLALAVDKGLSLTCC